nr:axin-1-like [Lytechinus pictus]XP_054762625.1 axin-1-like [Lytechinus pictus]XP_054762626.1 axin-1-like [Lytechinus pictus]XP_054762627.1 axin-1-like [Lytechinus pictus]XP_054762628.1 axin-1-like [Lytechinus pictus]
MSLEVYRFLADSGGSQLSERPPVPGEETEDRGSVSSSVKSGKQSDQSAGTPRRSNLKDAAFKGGMLEGAPLGFEPEGSASVTPPYTRWTESLHALLSDEDGIQLFKHYLIQEGAENPLLFWLATQGFKKKSDSDPVRTDLAKLIYRRFIKKDGQQVVRLHGSTRNHVAESIRTNKVDSNLFDASQMEVEEYMRETSYPMFLKSDVYVQYVNNGGVSPKSSEGCSSNGSNSHPAQAGYLPTLPEDSELSDLPQAGSLTADLLLRSSHHRHNTDRYQDRLYPGLLGSQNPYHPGCAAIAPATSNNDSELQSLSSDAISDDTMSLTDSSVDGFPVRSRQQQKRRQKRNMKYNIRQNGKVMTHLPCPRAHPRELPPTDPVEFAKKLTEKLEKVLAEREAKERLAAKLRKVEEEEHECKTPASTTMRAPGNQIFPVHDFVEDDPNSILEDHMSRVFRDSNRHTPRSQSPDHHRNKMPPSMANVPQVSLHPKQITSHPHHSRHHMSKSQKELIVPPNMASVGLAETPYMTYIEDNVRHKKRSSKKSDISSISKTTDSGIYEGPPSLPSDSENSMKRVADWIREGDEQPDPRLATQPMHHKQRHRMHPEHNNTMTMSTMSKKPVQYNTSRPNSMERERTHTPTTNLAKRSSPHLPKQPFIQDPKMPLMQPPEPLTVLEEARRRIDMSSRQQRMISKTSDPRKEKRPGMMPTMPSSSMSGQTRSTMPTSISDNQIYPGLSRPPTTGGKRPTSSSSSSKSRPTSSSGTMEKKVQPSITIAYYLCNDPIPYRTSLPGSEITLRQFKALISKKGTYRYTFKMPSTEFESGVVHQILVDDDAVLPLYEGKVVGKVESVDDN